MMAFLVLALSTLVSEDLACIAAGALVARGDVPFVTAAAACASGIFLGDLMVFAAGWFGGGWLRRRIPETKLARAMDWVKRRQILAVLLTRFIPGSRVAAYFAAGLIRARAVRFTAALALAAAVWAPLLVGATAQFGAAAARTTAGAFGGTATVIALFWLGRKAIRSPQVRRLARWEFWPRWMAYAPVIPYLAWLALKHRSATLFTAANPGIDTGGLFGESKSLILDRLRPATDHMPRHVLVPAGSVQDRASTVIRFMEQEQLSFPVVLKPDRGERGSGVAVIRSRAELWRYLAQHETETIAQEYVKGLEFGVFYFRRPGESRGQIFSITEKRFPEVTGDGRSTLRELIAADPRARLIPDVYARNSRRDPLYVPAAGIGVRLVEIGSHCRGAVFVDASRLATAELERALDRVATLHPGFYIGRFDLRAESVEALRNGQFRVLELNGVGGEAAHIYDPAVSIVDAYRSLFRQWRLAFEIGAANRASGAAPMGVRAILRALRDRWSAPAWTGIAVRRRCGYATRDDSPCGTGNPPSDRGLEAGKDPVVSGGPLKHPARA